jgi:hypothetical protein
MKLRLFSVLLAAFLAGELASPVLAQRARERRSPPPAQFDDFDDGGFDNDDFDDDDRDFRRQPHPSRGQDVGDEDDGDFFWLYVIIILALVGGGGGWFWWDHFDGDVFGD